MAERPERSYRGLLWGLALGGALLDQVSKYGVFKWLYDDRHLQGEYDLVPGVFKLLAQFQDRPDTAGGFLAPMRTLGGELPPKVNHGALFGFLAGYNHLANGIFAGVSLLAIVAIVYWSTRRTTVRDGFLCTALGLILAGTVGNLYDRVVFGGVRDFLYFYADLAGHRWPVFNIADCCLVCGAFLLLTQALWSRAASAEKQQAHVARTPEVAEVK
jgi:lipoprotein signal peptidase